MYYKQLIKDRLNFAKVIENKDNRIYYAHIGRSCIERRSLSKGLFYKYFPQQATKAEYDLAIRNTTKNIGI